MNTGVFSRVCLLLCGLGLLAAPASAVSPGSDVLPTLKVQVKFAPSWNLAAEDPLPGFIADSICDALARRGLTWRLATVRSVEDPNKVPYLLKIDVTDWRRRTDGDYDCTFAATLRTPQGERQIGVYANTTWAPGVIYAHSKSAYFPLWSDPIGALCRDLEKTKLFSDTAS